MSEWRPMKMAELGKFSSGKSIKPGLEGPFRAFGSNGVIGGAPESRHRHGVVVGRVGAYCGSVAISHEPFWASDNTIVVEPLDANDLDFLYYLLRSANLNQHAGGAAQPLVTQTTLKRLTFRVPGPSGRLKVSAVLRALDDLIENNRRRVEVLEEMARAIYREWFVRFRYPGHEGVPLVDSPIGPIPDGWHPTTVGNCASALVDGDWIETKDQGGSDYRLLQVSNIGVGRFRETGKFRYITAETFDRLRCTAIKVGDILISRMPDPIGRAWLVDDLPELAITAVDVAILTPRSSAIGSYLNQVFNSNEHLAWAETVATGTTRKRITRSVLSQGAVLLPNDEALERYHAQTAAMRSMSARLRGSEMALASIRDLLLPKLVTGQIDVSHLDLDALTEAATA